MHNDDDLIDDELARAEPPKLNTPIVGGRVRRLAPPRFASMPGPVPRIPLEFDAPHRPRIAVEVHGAGGVTYDELVEAVSVVPGDEQDAC